MQNNYYYVACDGGINVKEKYRHYFRLYKRNPDGVSRLVDQGLSEKISDWENKYQAALELENPYPLLD